MRVCYNVPNHLWFCLSVVFRQGGLLGIILESWSRPIVLCSWARPLTLTVPHSTRVGWVAANLMFGEEQPCNRLGSGGVEIFQSLHAMEIWLFML